MFVWLFFFVRSEEQCHIKLTLPNRVRQDLDPPHPPKKKKKKKGAILNERLLILMMFFLSSGVEGLWSKFKRRRPKNGTCCSGLGHQPRRPTTPFIEAWQAVVPTIFLAPLTIYCTWRVFPSECKSRISPLESILISISTQVDIFGRGGQTTLNCSWTTIYWSTLANTASVPQEQSGLSGQSKFARLDNFSPSLLRAMPRSAPVDQNFPVYCNKMGAADKQKAMFLFAENPALKCFSSSKVF